jgi:aryl-alcohol dehydrogenase-like predicted oxidoreductase
MEAHRVAAEYRLIGPTMEQPQYNMFERQKMENEFLGIFNTVGLGTTIWSPMASGLLSGKYNEGLPKNSRLTMKGFEWLAERWLTKDKLDKVMKLAKLAKELNVSLPQLSIAWCIQNPNVSTAILGATRKEQLVETMQSIEVVSKLTPEVLAKIEKIMDTKPVLPAF